MVQLGWPFRADNDRRTLYHHLEETRRLLPTHQRDAIVSALPAKEVTKVALRLKYQIEQIIPFELKESTVTSANSHVITKDVVETARKAGGSENKACVVYCLLVCVQWFKVQALVELWDSTLHDLRAKACEMLAKRLIESEENNNDYLMMEVLLKRYSIIKDGEETPPCNVVERAVDLHALEVIGSSGYQKCIKYLWHGWLCQDDKDPANFIEYSERTNVSYWAHFNPDRLRVPVHQIAVQISFSIIYLVLYTAVINTVNPTGDLDIAEGLLYTMTLGFILDEFNKFWKIGRYYLGFWNVFNLTLYCFLVISFVVRMIALSYPLEAGYSNRNRYNELSYNFLAFCAPMFWMRILLYLDTYRFFGVMLVVLKVMMKESLIFFALLAVIIVGFLQAFLGMDQADSDNTITASMILQGMANTILQDPVFDMFQNFASPFGIILYYLFTFVVMVVLLNILIALYNSAYSDITENAINEYLGLFAHRTLQFVRAPDENVFIAPLNLIEIFGLVIPFEWWLPDHKYERLNHYVMAVIYSPLLFLTSFVETHNAKQISLNRRLGEEDDDRRLEWEVAASEVGVDLSTGEESGDKTWSDAVARSKPNVAVDPCLEEVKKLKEEIDELKALVQVLIEAKVADTTDLDIGDNLPRDAPEENE